MGLGEQRRVLQRHPGRGGERRDQLLVVGAELAATLVGQVQVAEDPVLHPYRNAQERAHWWMVGREADRGVMLGDVGHAQRPGTSMSWPSRPLPSGSEPMA